MPGFFRRLFSLPPKNEYRLTYHYGSTSYEILLDETRAVAEGDAVSSVENGNADFVILEEKVDGVWHVVFRYPQAALVAEAQWADART